MGEYQEGLKKCTCCRNPTFPSHSWHCPQQNWPLGILLKGTRNSTHLSLSSLHRQHIFFPHASIPIECNHRVIFCIREARQSKVFPSLSILPPPQTSEFAPLSASYISSSKNYRSRRYQRGYFDGGLIFEELTRSSYSPLRSVDRNHRLFFQWKHVCFYCERTWNNGFKKVVFRNLTYMHIFSPHCELICIVPTTDLLSTTFVTWSVSGTFLQQVFRTSLKRLVPNQVSPCLLALNDNAFLLYPF